MHPERVIIFTRPLYQITNEIESIVLDVDLGLNMNITTFSNIQLPANDEKFRWINPQAIISLQSAQDGKYYEIGNIQSTLDFDGWNATLKFSGTVDLYSYNQIAEFIKNNGDSDILVGKIDTEWFFLNNING